MSAPGVRARPSKAKGDQFASLVKRSKKGVINFDHNLGQQYAPQPQGGAWEGFITFLRFVGLFSLVPIMFSIPFGIQFATEFFADKLGGFYYLWAVYGVVWLFLLVTKKNHSWESFFTHFLTYALFALGSFAMVGVFNFLDQHKKMVVLLLWFSFTFSIYLIYEYLDHTDYHKMRRQEDERERREDEEFNAELNRGKRRKEEKSAKDKGKGKEKKAKSSEEDE